MGVPNTFAGRYNVNDYAYGCNNVGKTQMPGPLSVGIGTTAAGAATVTLNYSYVTLPDSTQFFPLATNAPITIGSGTNAETVTPSAVGNATINAGQLTCTVTATFANAHGLGDLITSGTFGLQEAINAASANGGGEVVITPAWYARGGTAAMIAAATIPTYGLSPVGSTGLVTIVDLQTKQAYTYTANSVTVVAAPSAATALTVASTTTTGTWTAITIHVLFTYVTPDGGESLASADYSFTATADKAIGGTGPAASTGAVGYRVYMGANATTTCYLSPVTAANGTVIQCGPIAAFKIGTSFSVATANVAAALIPVQSTAFPVGFHPGGAGLQGPIIEGPFAVTGVVTASTAKEVAKIQLPAAALNTVNKAMSLDVYGIWTPVSTAVLILSVAVGSTYTGTETTIFTVTTSASSGTTAANWQIHLLLRTAATGATGTIECHGFAASGLATATANLGEISVDTTQTASSGTMNGVVAVNDEVFIDIDQVPVTAAGNTKVTLL